MEGQSNLYSLVLPMEQASLCSIGHHTRLKKDFSSVNRDLILVGKSCLLLEYMLFTFVCLICCFKSSSNAMWKVLSKYGVNGMLANAIKSFY